MEIKQLKKIPLEDLESGTLFLFNEVIALKTEYLTEKGAVKSYIVGSGEMFWGGVHSVEELSNLLVTPLSILINSGL